MHEDKITEEELKAITDAAAKRNVAVAAAERATMEAKTATLEAKNAELIHQVNVQHVFMKYGLTFTDKIDDKTGVITRGSKATAELLDETTLNTEEV